MRYELKAHRKKPDRQRMAKGESLIKRNKPDKQFNLFDVYLPVDCTVFFAPFDMMVRYILFNKFINETKIIEVTNEYR